MDNPRDRGTTFFIRSTLFGVLILSGLNTLVAREQTPAMRQCESRWDELHAKYSKDVAVLESEWKALEPLCGQTGVFEYHLATLAEVRGDFDSAIAILSRAINAGYPLRKELQVTVLGMEFNKADQARPRSENDVRVAHSRIEQFLSNNPNFAPAIHVGASQRAALRDYAGAEELARKGLALDPTNARSRSALVIALAATNRCGEAKPLIRPTLEKNDSMFGDFQFMLAAAFCYFDTGDVLTSEQVLLALRARLPAAADEPSFKRLAKLILKAKADSQ